MKRNQDFSLILILIRTAIFHSCPNLQAQLVEEGLSLSIYYTAAFSSLKAVTGSMMNVSC
jgi:hypothetical protein